MRPGILYPDGFVPLVNPVLNSVAVVDIILEEPFEFAFQFLDLAGYPLLGGCLEKAQCLGRSLGIAGTNVLLPFSGFLAQPHLIFG